MGTSSGGAGLKAASSSDGSGEFLGADTSDFPRRMGSMDEPERKRHSDSYWNRSNSSNQRTWSTEEDQPPRALLAGYGSYAMSALFAISVSLWMIFGLYGNQRLEMGTAYSRVVKANSIFVKKIQVRNLKEIDPVTYSFSTKPALDSPVFEKQKMEDVIIDPKWQKRFTYWLNKGSYLELSCSLKDSSSGSDSLIVAVVKGEDGFQDWKEDPDNPSLSLRWKRMHDYGSLSLKVEEDDDYSIVFGNLNNRKITLSFTLDFCFLLHSKENADLLCSTQFTNMCDFPVALGQSTYVLLTTPVINTLGVEVWRSEISYSPRWIAYTFLWGLFAAGLLFKRAFELRQATSEVTIAQEHDPLRSSDSDSHLQAPSALDSPVTAADEADENENASISSSPLCSICLDALKDSFFDPCGHRCTCYACGIRIQRDDSNGCPICRRTIRAVRRIYDS